MSDPPRFCFLECIFMWKTLQQNLLSTLYSKTFFNCYILFPILFKFNENFSVFNLAGLEHSNLTTFLYKILYYYKTSVSLKNPIIYKKLYNTIKKTNPITIMVYAFYLLPISQVILAGFVYNIHHIFYLANVDKCISKITRFEYE